MSQPPGHWERLKRHSQAMSESLQTMESAEAVFAVLETFRKFRTPMSVTTHKGADLFTSYLLKAKQNQLCIDQLVPKTGNLLLQPGQTIEFRIRYQGTTYLFNSIHLAQCWDDAGFEYHQIALPAQIQHLDKRAYYRIHIKLAENPVVQISMANGKPVEVRCENISKTGACLRFQDKHFSLETNNSIDCTIHLDGFDPLKCKAVVRYHQFHSNTSKNKIGRVGIEFLQLPPADKKKLHKVLMKMQRHNLRSNMAL